MWRRITVLWGWWGLVLATQGEDSIVHVGCHLCADFHAEDQFVWEEWGKGDEEATEAAADVCDSDGFGEGSQCAFLYSGVMIYEGWIVGGPIHLVRTDGTREATWVRMGFCLIARVLDGVMKLTMSKHDLKMDWHVLFGDRISSWAALRCHWRTHGRRDTLHASAACLLQSCW